MSRRAEVEVAFRALVFDGSWGLDSAMVAARNVVNALIEAGHLTVDPEPMVEPTGLGQVVALDCHRVPISIPLISIGSGNWSDRLGDRRRWSDWAVVGTCRPLTDAEAERYGVTLPLTDEDRKAAWREYRTSDESFPPNPAGAFFAGWGAAQDRGADKGPAR